MSRRRMLITLTATSMPRLVGCPQDKWTEESGQSIERKRAGEATKMCPLFSGSKYDGRQGTRTCELLHVAQTGPVVSGVFTSADG